MNDFRLYFYAMEQEFLFIPDVTRQHFIFILEAFRKVGRRRESHFIRYFRNALAGFLQQSLTILQARFAQQVYSRKPCKSLTFLYSCTRLSPICFPIASTPKSESDI